MSISTRIAFAASLPVLVACGAAIFLLVDTSRLLEQELLDVERDVAQLLGGVRTSSGTLDFSALNAIVEHADRPEVRIRVVYAIELDRAGRRVQGRINPRLFAALDPSFRPLVLEGRGALLDRLAAGKVDRGDKIWEIVVGTSGGQIKLGFDPRPVDERVREVMFGGLIVVGATFLVGALLAVLAGRWVAAPVRKLARSVSRASSRGGAEELELGAATGELAPVAHSFARLRAVVREQEDVRDRLAPYLGRPVMDRILKEASALELSAEERAVTVLCIVFPGFTTLGSNLRSLEALRLLNDYLAPIIDAIIEHQGTVTQIEGGRIIAVWGAPVQVKDPELQAIKAAAAARAASRQETRRQAAVGNMTFDPALGIATARAVVGNVGSARRVVYTVLGVAVELALYIANQAQPGEILVNEAAFSKVRGQVQGTAGNPLILEGMEEAVPLYRVEARPAAGAGSRTSMQ